MLHKLSFLATFLGLLSASTGSTLFISSDYSEQKGTEVAIGSNTVKSFDSGDYLTYASANFGPAGTTKGIRINYTKGNTGGRVEVRLGLGTEGKLIGEFKPAKTQGWSNYITAYFDIEEDVQGTQDITFVAKDNSGVLNLAWFELSDFSERSDEYSRIPATEYADQNGIELAIGRSTFVGSFDRGDYVTYANVNFGPAGTTKSVDISYAKGNSGGKVEVMLGGAGGTKVGELKPSNTGGWGNWAEANISLDVDVDGIHDLTFVAKGTWGVLNLEWFQLSNADMTLDIFN